MEALAPTIRKPNNNDHNPGAVVGKTILKCTAKNCDKSFSFKNPALARKALMRHLHRYTAIVKRRDTKDEEDKSAEDKAQGGSKKKIRKLKLAARQKKRDLEAAHYSAWLIEHEAAKTSKEKQKASRERYKMKNPEKVARASRIANFRARAKKIPEVASQGKAAIEKWAEDKELERERKLALENEKKEGKPRTANLTQNLDFETEKHTEVQGLEIDG